MKGDVNLPTNQASWYGSTALSVFILLCGCLNLLHENASMWLKTVACCLGWNHCGGWNNRCGGGASGNWNGQWCGDNFHSWAGKCVRFILWSPRFVWQPRFRCCISHLLTYLRLYCMFAGNFCHVSFSNYVIVVCEHFWNFLFCCVSLTCDVSGKVGIFGTLKLLIIWLLWLAVFQGKSAFCWYPKAVNMVIAVYWKNDLSFFLHSYFSLQTLLQEVRWVTE